MKTTPRYLPLAVLCALAAFASAVFAQETPPPKKSGPKAGNKSGATRERDREPSWLMEKIEGPNLHYKTFESKAAATKVSYLIFLPPGYEKDEQRRYPVVYWLHGIGGSQQGVPAMADQMTKAIEAGKMPPTIFVFCNGMIRGGWSDAQWPVETVTIKELMPHIETTYRTIATREGRGVEGFSMGGGGAATWGFKYPELFSSVSILAGARMGGPGGEPPPRKAKQSEDAPAKAAKSAGAAPERMSRESPWALVKKNLEAIRGHQVVRIAVGANDPLMKSNTSLHEFLTEQGIEHDFDIVPNAAHSPGPVYQGLGDKNWAFYQKAFGKLK